MSGGGLCYFHRHWQVIESDGFQNLIDNLESCVEWTRDAGGTAVADELQALVDQVKSTKAAIDEGVEHFWYLLDCCDRIPSADDGPETLTYWVRVYERDAEAPCPHCEQPVGAPGGCWRCADYAKHVAKARWRVDYTDRGEDN